MDLLVIPAAADEGISSDMTLEAAPATQSPAAQAGPAPCPQQLLGDGSCCSSEGYATSQGSLTSSETISPASETEDTTEEDTPAAAIPALIPSTDEALKLDSLTLALEELRSANAAAAAISMQAPLTVETRARSAKPAGKRPQQHQQQRSSSMKSQKTPPGTPNQMKKVVRFADAFGLDLTYVKHVFDTENPPVIPAQAMRDLNLAECLQAPADSRLRPSNGSAVPSQAAPERRLFVSPCFAQPGCCANFVPRVLAQKVVLERASVNPATSEIQGVVRVSNIGFEKSVLVRVTFDSWRSSSDFHAQYVTNSSNGPTDQFAFTAPLPAHFSVGDRAVFCVRYCVCGETFWDNNFGDNYSFDCFAVNANCDATGPAWTHFL